MQFNRDKFKALVHLVCRECRDPSKLGKTKLHKILWLSDVENYKIRATPLSGERYIKQRFGPCADHLDSVLNELVKEGRLHIESPEEEYESFKFYAKGEPDISLFSDKEMNTIKNQIINIYGSHTATSISDRSHDEIWEMAIMYEEIPYHAYLVKRLAIPTEEDFAWAKAEIEKL